LVTKEDISDLLNDILKTEDPIDFTKMNKDDLEALLKILGEPTNLIQIGLKNLREKTKKEILNMTIRDLLNRSVLEEIIKDEGGPLGFGIIPSILRMRKRVRTIKYAQQ